MTIRRSADYVDLRKWISENQIYKVIREWSDGNTAVLDTCSEELLKFDFMKNYGHLINWESALFLTQDERLRILVNNINEGYSDYEIGSRMGISQFTAKKLRSRLKKFNYDVERYLATKGVDTKTIRHRYIKICELENEGMNNYQISKVLNVSPSTVLRTKEWVKKSNV